MAWIVMVVAGALGAVWAVALGTTEGLTRLVPTVVFLTRSPRMAGLANAMRTLPIGTSYAIWVGIGAALKVASAWARRARSRRPRDGSASLRARPASASAGGWRTPPGRSSSVMGRRAPTRRGPAVRTTRP
jgi:quaternary ammonium compound-resistance protein SugE